jgi:hypothetical protein
MHCTSKISLALATVATLFGMAKPPEAKAQEKKPNIVVIMGDDIGMWNIGAYHRGLMAGRTPNLDKLAKEGMLFTDYYAEASCQETNGRASHSGVNHDARGSNHFLPELAKLRPRLRVARIEALRIHHEFECPSVRMKARLNGKNAGTDHAVVPILGRDRLRHVQRGHEIPESLGRPWSIRTAIGTAGGHPAEYIGALVDA